MGAVHDWPRCCACGNVWPCPTPGGLHITFGQLEAQVKETERRKAEAEESDNGY